MKTSGFRALHGFRRGQGPFFLRNHFCSFLHEVQISLYTKLWAVRWVCEQHSPAQSLASWNVHLGTMAEPYMIDRQMHAQNCCFCSLTKSCPTLCKPMACSTSGSPVLYCLPGLTQIHDQLVMLTISNSVSPFSFCLQSFPASGSFTMNWLCIRYPKYWSFSFSISPSIEYSGLISLRIDCFDILAVQGTLKSFLQHYHSKAYCSVVFCLFVCLLIFGLFVWTNFQSPIPKTTVVTSSKHAHSSRTSRLFCKGFHCPQVLLPSHPSLLFWHISSQKYLCLGRKRMSPSRGRVLLGDPD